MNQITLDDVSDYLEQWHKYGGYGMSLCPFHDDHSPSCCVGATGFKCLSCGEHGSLEKLYQKVSGRVIKHERVYNQSAFIWKKWEEQFGSIQNVAKVAHKELTQCLNLGSYLEKRGIAGEIKNGMLGFLDGWYTFPIKNEYGEIDGIVARASPSIQTKNIRYTVSKNCPTKLYVPNFRRVLSSEEIFVCYGTLDSWSLHLAGYASVTGISGQELNYKNLDRFRKRMWIIPDKGEERNAMELQTHLGWRMNCLRLEWPENCKDVNDIHTKFGLEKVQELIEKQKEKFVYA
jgi:DNA primase